MSPKLCRHRVQSVRPGIAGSARTRGEGHLGTIPTVRISEADGPGKRQIWALANAPLPSEYDGGTQRRDTLRHRAAVWCRSLAARVMGELPNRVCLRLYLWQLRAQGIRRRSIRVAAKGASCDSRDVAWPAKPTVPAGRLTTAPKLFPCHLPLASVTACEIKSKKKKATASNQRHGTCRRALPQPGERAFRSAVRSA